MCLKKPRSTYRAVATDIRVAAMKSGSQTGRLWSACQVITVNNTVVKNRMRSRQFSVKYLVLC